MNKKLAQIYRELEKQQLSLERRITSEEFNERVESKADKQMLVNVLQGKVSKSEMEAQINTRVSELRIE